MSEQLRFEKIVNAEQIYALLKQFDCIFPHLKEKISSYEEYAEKLSKYANTRVALIGEEICGLLVYYANDTTTKTAYIALIGVLPQFQGCGLGGRLLDYCIREAKRQDMQILKLEVDLDNPKAISFYKKNAFVECEFDNQLSIKMQKSLVNG